MTLSETVELMNSTDYKERFRAEYLQLVIRYRGLSQMLKKWDNGTLDFTPSCPRSTYNMQINAMTDYIAVLEARAVMEGIDISEDIVKFLDSKPDKERIQELNRRLKHNRN